MKDKDLEAFVAAIERHFSARRGHEHVLSPRDFALAREWHSAGVPLATVLAGIDRVLTPEKDVASLLYCRRSVAALASAAEHAPALSNALPPPKDLVARLLALRSAIAALKQPALFERPERRLLELLDLVAVAREPNWGYLRGELLQLDRLVDAAALEALPPAEREGGGDALRHQDLCRRARERFALPRVSGD